MILPLNVRLGICPYCGQNLNIIARTKQKVRKKYKCNRCGKIIDSRGIIF